MEADEKEEKPELPVTVDQDKVSEYLGPQRYFREVAERTQRSGVSTGLAWTSSGGDILFIETTRMPGKGKTVITGRLGEVMKESVQAAISYLRASAKRFGLEARLFETGAIPKDGPSAGNALMVSILSLLLDRPVPADLAMTGEITLRGKVLPVGGIKEKVLAAKRAGIKRVILPKKNEMDLEDLPDHVREAIEFHPVETMDDVLRETFGEEVFLTAAPVAPAPGSSGTEPPQAHA